MSEEQWFGVFFLAIGIYFTACAAAFPNFALYKMKVERAKVILSERAAHTFYLSIGIILILVGLLKAIGLF